MRVAYVSSDEVNRDLALQMAKQSGMALSSQPDSGRPSDQEFDAAIYDFDFLPIESRQQILNQVIRRPAAIPTAVHGYNLVADHKRSLKKQGVIFFRKLDARLFKAIKRRIAESEMAKRRAVEETLSSSRAQRTQKEFR